MKNLRLLARFPGVVSQTVYRSLTLVPVIMILGGKLRMGGGVQVVAPLLVFLTGPVAPLYHGAHSYLIAPAVKGWEPALLGYHRYQLVRLEN